MNVMAREMTEGEKMKTRFKEVRTHFSLSQIQFAQKINRSAGLISNIETGRSGVSDDTIRDIHTVFGVDEEWLKTGRGTMFPEGAERCAVNKVDVGSRIKLVRKEMGLSQEQFAEALGHHKMHVYYVETGKYSASNDFLMKVSTVFGVDYDWLMTGQGERKNEQEACVLDPRLLDWLRVHPDVVQELMIRSGLG